MPTQITEPPADWPAAQLHELDRDGTGAFALRRGPDSHEFWFLDQGSRPVGLIRRADAGTWLRSVSEEWRMRVTRRSRRLGWRLVYAPTNDGEALVRYSPHTLRQGGALEILGGSRYTLRGPLLRADWRLIAPRRDEMARIAFRRHGRPEPARPQRHRLKAGAAEEPLLPLVMLAAGAAILVHHYEHLMLPTGNV
jgi:hypothetical protein